MAAFRRNVLHAWSISAPESFEHLAGCASAHLDHGIHSLLALAQAIGGQGITAPIEWIALSNGIHDVTGDEPLSPAKTVLLSALKIVPREYPNVRCRSLDIVLDSSAAPERILPFLLDAGAPRVSGASRTPRLEAVLSAQPAGCAPGLSRACGRVVRDPGRNRRHGFAPGFVYRTLAGGAHCTGVAFRRRRR